MDIFTVDQLTQKKCTACEGGVEAIPASVAQQQLAALSEWKLDPTGKMITRQRKCSNFVEGMKLLHQIADIAEEEQHHPDLHLTGYRHVKIELTTHAIGGLSENDFILAAKIEGILNQD